MTPQEKAIGDLLQVSLFKLGDEFHAVLDKVRERKPEKAAEIDVLAREIEGMIDNTIAGYRDNKGDFSMKDVDTLHARIVELRHLTRGHLG